MIVASDNYANFVSLRWFLNQVLPLAGDVPLSIYGNIDAGVKNRDKALYEAHRALFKGRVADLRRRLRRRRPVFCCRPSKVMASRSRRWRHCPAARR